MKLGLLLVAILLVACSKAAPTATSVPPTSTPAVATSAPTAVPSTATSAPATATARPATATAIPVAASLPACGDESAVSRLELATAPAPTPTPASPAATPVASPTPPPPTATPRPAPQVDRVGFPEGYSKSFKQFYIFDRLDAKSVSFICGNDVATSVKSGEPFPYGSILVFEAWRANQDASGTVVKDANGHLIRERLNTIFLMRKEKGFGEDYQALRTGEWEYVAFRPDKTFSTAPKDTAFCAACHQALSQSKERDWVFRPELFFAKDRYAQTPPIGPNEIGASRMAFSPATRTIKVGATLKWTNSAVDKIDHTVTALDASFDSGVLKPGASFTKTFDAPGTFQYVCAIHPEQLKGKIEVTN